MLLTVNPPPILIDDTKAAPSASECAGVCGVSPPPIKCKAPAKFLEIMSIQQLVTVCDFESEAC